MTREQIMLIEKLSSELEKSMVEYAYRSIGNQQIAKEVVQETFWTACRKIDKVIYHENPVGWLFLTLSNLVKREKSRAYHRQEKLVDNIDIMGQEEFDLPMGVYLPKGLSEKEQDIILLYLEKKLSFGEIAEIKGITLSACRQQYYRAIAHCRKLMEKST